MKRIKRKYIILGMMIMVFSGGLEWIWLKTANYQLNPFERIVFMLLLWILFLLTEKE